MLLIEQFSTEIPEEDTDQFRFRNFFPELVFVMLGVLIAAHTASGIDYSSPLALIVAVLILGCMNAFLKPFLIRLTLPFIVLTLGVGIWLINAVLFSAAGFFVSGFFVEGFPSAMWGALMVSITSIVSHLILGTGRSHIQVRRGNDDDRNDVIDI